MTADRHVDAGLMAVRTVVAQPTPDAVPALQTAAVQAFSRADNIYMSGTVEIARIATIFRL
jgi:hypothetical protein